LSSILKSPRYRCVKTSWRCLTLSVLRLIYRKQGARVDKWKENKRYPTGDLINLYYSGCFGNSLDIVFALDASGSIGSRNYQDMLQFVGNVIMSMTIRSSQTPNGNQVGLVIFSDHATPEFYLNTFTDKTLMLAAIDVPYTTGRTNVADALRSDVTLCSYSILCLILLLLMLSKKI